jgi:hypothetical protein
MSASHCSGSASKKLKAMRLNRCGAATLAAVDAGVDAVVPPVVMNELNPGFGTEEPFGMTSRTSSSVTPSMPMPVCGSEMFKGSRQRRSGCSASGCSNFRYSSSPASICDNRACVEREERRVELHSQRVDDLCEERPAGRGGGNIEDLGVRVAVLPERRYLMRRYPRGVFADLPCEGDHSVLGLGEDPVEMPLGDRLDLLIGEELPECLAVGDRAAELRLRRRSSGAAGP